MRHVILLLNVVLLFSLAVHRADSAPETRFTASLPHAAKHSLATRKNGRHSEGVMPFSSVVLPISKSTAQYSTPFPPRLRFYHEGRICVTWIPVIRGVGKFDTIVQVWNLVTRRVMFNRFIADDVVDVWFSNKSDTMAICTSQIETAQVTVWKLGQTNPTAVIPITTTPGKSVGLHTKLISNPDESLLVAGDVSPGSRTAHDEWEPTAFGGLTLIDTNTWQVLHRPGTDQSPRSVDRSMVRWAGLQDDKFVMFWPNKRWMLTLPRDGRGAYRVWDLDQCKFISPRPYQAMLSAMQMNLCGFTNDNVYLIGPQSDYNKPVEIYSTHHGRLVSSLSVQSGETESFHGMRLVSFREIALSKVKNRFLVNDRGSHVVRLFQTPTGSLLGTFRDFPGSVYKKPGVVIFTADGTLILSYAVDGHEIFFHDAATGRGIGVFSNISHPIFSVTLSPNGVWAAISMEGSPDVSLWRVKDLVAWAHRAATQ